MARLLKPDFVKFLPIREFHQIQSGKIIFSHPAAQVYYCMKQIRIDTVGYDDSTNRNDEDNFKEVLKFIDQHGLQNVHAIGNVQLFVNLIFILYARWRFKFVCLPAKLVSLAIRKKI